MTYGDGRKPVTANWINGHIGYEIQFTDKDGNKYNGTASEIEGSGIHTKNGKGAM